MKMEYFETIPVTFFLQAMCFAQKRRLISKMSFHKISPKISRFQGKKKPSNIFCEIFQIDILTLDFESRRRREREKKTEKRRRKTHTHSEFEKLWL